MLTLISGPLYVPFPYHGMPFLHPKLSPGKQPLPLQDSAQVSSPPGKHPLPVQNIYVINFFSFIPEESTSPHPIEGKSRDMMSSSVEISVLHPSHEDSIRPGQHLKTDAKESSSTEFRASDMKYLLYEDERDFKVKLMRKQL